MADNIGPQQYQGGISGAQGTPQMGRYNRQVDPNGASQPANAQGARVISGFGEGSAALAAGLNVAVDAAEKQQQAQNRLWLTHAKSVAELTAQQFTIDAANNAQAGDTIAPTLQKNWQQYSRAQLSTVKDPILKAHLDEVLTETGTNTTLKAQAFDETQRTDYALFNFSQAIENKAKLYLGMGYSDIDKKLGGDLGELNSTLNSTVIDPNQRLKLRTEMMKKLTDAANWSKLTQDPQRYKTEQATAHPPEMRLADQSMPRGIRNNNPGNLTGTDAWQGKSGADDKGFVQFATPEAGLRAMALDLKNQQDMHGLNTVEDIVSKYAPPTENNTPAYITAVAKTMGVKPDEKIDLSKPALLSAMMHAMIQHENGVQPYSGDSIMWAAASAAEPELAGPPPPSSADAGSKISVTQQGAEGGNHVTNGSLAFSMGTYEQQKQWMSEAHTAQDALYADQERVMRLQKEQLVQAQLQTKNDLLTKFYDDKLSYGDVMNSNLPAFGEGSKKEFIELMKKGPDADGNERLHQQLYVKTLNGEINDPSELVPYLTQENGINTAQAQNIASLLTTQREQVQKTFITGAKSQITGSTDFVPDPEGDAQYSAFLFDMQRQLQEGQKKGLTPRDMLDPASKDYIGDKLISSYRRSPQERINAMANQIKQEKATQGDKNVRLPNESISDWLKRTKGGK